MDFLSLPTSVVCEVTKHVSIKDFVRLDSAFCHHHHRFFWLELLESNEFTINCIVNISNRGSLSWVLTKNLKCSHVEFTVDQGASKNISDFLRVRGSSIRTVHFQDGTKQLEMVLVALHCQNLTKVCVVRVDLSSAFGEILLRNSKIQRIWCWEVACSEDDIFAGVTLHALDALLVFNTHCRSGFPWHESAHSDSLRIVALNECTNIGPNLQAMLRNCPNLRICSANFVANGSNILVLPNLGLQTISIYGNDGITDGHIKAMVNNLTSLRVLNILNCNALTDLSLQHIAEHGGDRLEVLYVDIKHPESAETDAYLEIFSQKCSKLTYLNIYCGDNVLCMGKGTSALVCGCPALHWS